MLPRLTYLLTTYNRKDFIRKSLASALDQDYAGELEIIVSDDCSTDGTYEIIRDMADGYEGRHKLVVTQTPVNDRQASNTNHALQFATSDWIVKADDDDLSATDRCTVLAGAIQRHPGATALIQTSKIVTSRDELTMESLGDRSGPVTMRRVPIEELERRGNMNFNQDGYTYKAWSRRVYSQFAPLPSYSYLMDDYFAYIRSLVLGDCIMIDGPPAILVHWGEDNSSGNMRGVVSLADVQERERYYERYFRVSTPALEVLAREVTDYVHRGDSPPGSELVVAYLERELRLFRIWDGFWTLSMTGRGARLRALAREEPVSAYHLLKILPRPVFCRLVYLTGRLKSLRGSR